MVDVGRSAIVTRALALALLWLLLARTEAGAAELVMFEAPGCEWCERWDEEIGVVYARTPEGRRAPLRRVQIGAPRPADLRHLRAIVYTPTFVVTENGLELGRIVGYPGEDFFWDYLAQILARMPGATGPQQARASWRPRR